MTYTPSYIKTAVFDLSKNEHELDFDNHTHCYGHSFSARLCVYTYYTTNSEKIRFTLTDLNFKGKYQGSNFAAGVFVYNQFGKTVVKLMKFNSNLALLEHTNMEIIGTKMHVAIFVYSYFASLSLTFSMFKTHCDILLVSKNYITHSGYITSVHGIPRAFYVSQSSKDLTEYDRCFQFQFFEIEDEIIIIFPENTQVLMTTTGFTFYKHVDRLCGTVFNELTNQYNARNKNVEYLDRKRIVSFMEYMKVFDCLPNTYMQVRLKWLPCKLPCQYLNLEKKCEIGNTPELMWHHGDNDTCNICVNKYTICDQVLLKNNFPMSIDIKPKRCASVDLSIRNRITDRSPAMILALNENNMISRVPDFTRWIYTWVYSDKCVVEIPKATLHINDSNTSPKRWATWDAIKTVYWRDVLYRGLSSQLLVSWEEAAQYCQDIRAFLLTIHSLAEYKFIKEAFLQPYDTSVLYVGLRREVMKVMDLIKSLFKTDILTIKCYVEIVCWPKSQVVRTLFLSIRVHPSSRVRLTQH